jgi:hypothetical protein
MNGVIGAVVAGRMATAGSGRRKLFRDADHVFGHGKTE